MKKVRFFIMILIISLSTCISLAEEKFDKNLTSKNELRKEDFQINGIKLGEPISEIRKILGEPKKVASDKKKIIYFYYPQLTIKSFFSEASTNRTIDYLLITNKSIKTFRGVSIGNNEKEVIYRYGKTTKFKII